MSENIENTETVAKATQRHRRQLTGEVVSKVPKSKTAVVKVTRTYLHPQYRKYVRRSKKYMTHDENDTTEVGDIIVIEECRPVSKRKRWRLRSIVRKNI
ncbi:MAG: 30S ribosomal protein S17 [Myxococcales bacterium]|nr:30S ribosomal protein S17 [Myxococcales bacterium]